MHMRAFRIERSECRLAIAPLCEPGLAELHLHRPVHMAVWYALYQRDNDFQRCPSSWRQAPPMGAGRGGVQTIVLLSVLSFGGVMSLDVRRLSDDGRAIVRRRFFFLP